jgi:hypothetical protein
MGKAKTNRLSVIPTDEPLAVMSNGECGTRVVAIRDDDYDGCPGTVRHHILDWRSRPDLCQSLLNWT